MTGEELKKMRLDANMTRRALALKLDTTCNTIYQWETNQCKIKKIYEIALIKVLNGEAGGDND